MRTYWKLRTITVAREEEDATAVLLGDVEDVFNIQEEAIEELHRRYTLEVERCGMWMDQRGGEPMQMGWVFRYRDPEDPEGKNLREDWVELLELTERHVIPEGMKEEI
jgi:hypothetical protein